MSWVTKMPAQTAATPFVIASKGPLLSRRRPLSPRLFPDSDMSTSPHITVSADGRTNKMFSSENPSIDSQPLTRTALTEPNLLPPTGFDEFRMPAFTMDVIGGASHFVEDESLNLQEPEHRDQESSSSTTAREKKTRHHRNRISLSGTEDNSNLLVAPEDLKVDRRKRNQALGADQFDDLLYSVFHS